MSISSRDSVFSLAHAPSFLHPADAEVSVSHQREIQGVSFPFSNQKLSDDAVSFKI